MAELEAALRERVEQLATRHNVPGVAVGVDLGGSSFFVCHGVTHVAHPLPVDPDTLFQIASNSKTFTATLVMQLVAEGALRLDDPVRKHLPALRMPDRRYDDQLTVRHLLSHRAGLDGDALFVRQPKPPTLENLFEPLSRARMLVPPGGPFTYCNAAFSVAGRLVEALRDQPYETALRERLVAPLGMKRTCTRADEAIFHRVAMRHLSLPGREPVALPGGGWQRGWELAPIDVPAGGLLSSASDLLRWLRFWLGRPDADATPPLDAALRAQMCELQGAPSNAHNGQALGWAVRFDPAARVLNHGGLTAGYASYTLFAPSLDLAMVVLTNGTAGGLVHMDLTRWLVGEVGGRTWADPSPLAQPPALEPYTGSYWGSFGTTLVRAVDGELELSTERHPTDDGSQLPPDPPVRVALCGERLGIATRARGQPGRARLRPRCVAAGLAAFRRTDLRARQALARTGRRLRRKLAEGRAMARERSDHLDVDELPIM
jgi:CubicO group peptidase (beta-lactamase class C family)